MKLKKTLCGIMTVLFLMSAIPVCAAETITICFDWETGSEFVDYKDGKAVSYYTDNIDTLPENVIGWKVFYTKETISYDTVLDTSMCGDGDRSDLIWLQAIYSDETDIEGVMFSWDGGNEYEYISPFSEGKTLSYYTGKLTKTLPDDLAGWKLYGSDCMLDDDTVIDETMRADGVNIVWLEAEYKKPEPEKDDTSGFNWLLIMELDKKFEITATAGEGGSISPAGVSEFKRGDKATYTFTPDNGYEIDSVIVNGEDKGAITEYTFTRVVKDQTISVSFKKSPVSVWENPFVDVEESDDFFDAVRFVYENGLFKGISDTEFAPETTMTRAMFVTILGRLANVDINEYNGKPFDDVVPGEYYVPYVEWAVENGMANGYGNGSFGVNDKVTIEQAVVFIARFAQLYGIETSCADINFDKYSDINDVSEWSLIEMLWALESGIYSVDDSVLNPQGEASRSLVAEMIYNFCSIYEIIG